MNIRTWLPNNSILVTIRRRPCGFFLVIFVIIHSVGCTSSNDPYGGRDPDENSRAHPAAYATERFMVEKKLPENEKGSKVDFFFKRCDQGGNENFYSRTSYDCNYPY